MTAHLAEPRAPQARPAVFGGRKIPATIITGFLGSGKTTLIRALLEQAHGKRLALIINEFGDLGVDGGLLRGCGFEACRDDDIMELNNGCICCTVAEDFVPAITKLLARREAPEHIIIETSGLALPQPLVAAFNWPLIKTQLTVDGVIAVIDAPAVAAGQFAMSPAAVDRQRQADTNLDHETPLSELFADQIQAADLIILNKADVLSAAEEKQARAALSAVNSRQTPILPAAFGNIGADILLGLNMDSQADIHNRLSQHELHHHAGGSAPLPAAEGNAENAPHDGHHHSHDEFTHFAVSFGAVRDIKAFAAHLQNVLADYDILRLKGFVAVAAKPMRCVAQAVGQRLETYFDRAWGAGEGDKSELVLIGLSGLDADAVSAAIKAAAAA